MAKKLPEDVAKRLFTNMYVCMKCNAKIRTQVEKVKKGKIKCRKCGYTKLRVKKKAVKAKK